MAVWQFTFKPIPRPAPGASPEDLWASFGWEKQPVPESLLSRLRSLLPLKETYGTGSDTTLVYGEQSQNDIHVDYEDGRVVELRIRLDLRNPDVALLQAIVEATAAVDAVFVSSDERVFEAEWNAVVTELLASRAAQFVEDPMGYLRRVADSASRHGSSN
ncbi:hypothetical protein [Deinococcus aestuarii]|uniref:hypothetical protein n=1 Tax=Deinococcus aestuarii TaxID=2774531 RepID=UPI001C0C7067|nr:hypothetical protein [Deinococcus aestuarii]